MYHAMFRLSDQLILCHSCDWLFIMKSSFAHAVSYLRLVLSSRNCSADEPNSLGLEAANTHFCKKTIKSWIYSIPADKPDSNYRKASQMPHNLPSWTVCYGKSPLLKNRLYQKRKKVLQFHEISLIVTVAPTADWKWNTSKPLQAVYWIETITCCQS